MTTTPPEAHADLTPEELEKKLSRQEEVWECQIPGRIHLTVRNYLGRTQDRTVKGKGNRLRISTWDRELVEEQIFNIHHNPFRNGMLVQVGGVMPPPDDTRPVSVSDEDLVAFFSVKDEDGFKEICDELSELNLRRLRDLSEISANEATRTQADIINEKIEERFRIGGDTPTYREMLGDDAPGAR